jgi:WXG100 family type VII secretion target
MADVEARITQMREAATNIGSSATTVNNCIEDVDKEVNALGPDRFISDAADVFRGAYSRLTPKLRDAYHDLEAFRKKLNDSADDIEVASRP